jgi:aspartokinase-like uncharacterized kinase
MFEALIKIGGSLYHQPNLRASVTAWADLSAAHRLLFLPGGGPFADSVRAADDRFQLGDSAAHWMAILAMDQFAWLLSDLSPKAVVVRDLAKAERVAAGGALTILAPSALLLEVDPLPHSWEITSDSIAAWLAHDANIPQLVLLKSLAGAPRLDDAWTGSSRLRRSIPAKDLTGYDIVDPYFGRALSPTTRCWLVDGRQPQRLAELLRSGETVGTEVVAE